MTNTAFTAAISRLDDRMLRDIGVATDGGATDERDPRFRRIARPVRPINRLLALITPPMMPMLLRG